MNIEKKLNRNDEKMRDLIKTNPSKWMLKFIFEPGYTIKNVLSVKKENPEDKKLNILTPIVMGLEVARLGLYGYTIYKIAEYFIK
ncbi:hypothetical protein KAI04_05015 [Candidatus Pacearchaeota archaeon]|nr:hypothetical protein [Candidatus Pacearchaeota archaeon]